jgi:hypothetical protein
MSYPTPLPHNASPVEEMAWDAAYVEAESKRVAQEEEPPPEFRSYPRRFTSLEITEDGHLIPDSRLYGKHYG